MLIRRTCRDVVKVPSGSMASARNLGIFNDVFIYYRLKTANDHGYFKSVLAISSFLGVSERTAHRWVSRLADLGLLQRLDSGINLVCYDVLFLKLGVDLKNGFKLFKIGAKYTLDRSNFISAVAKEEVRYNNTKQWHMASRKLRPKYRPDKGNLNANVAVSISCNRVASLLGYRSCSSGHRLERMIEVRYPESVSITHHCDVVGVFDRANKAKLPKGCYVQDGFILRRISNRISVY